MRAHSRIITTASWVCLVTLAACDQPSAPEAVETLAPPPGPALQILDAANGGRTHFYFLPPLAPDASPFGGTFDGTLQPTARICKLNATGTACDNGAADVATFPFSGGARSGITVNIAGQSYNTNWNSPSNLQTSPGTKYRLEVKLAVPNVGPTTLGFADLWVVNNSKDLKNVQAGFVGLVKGSPLQIKFRIETGAVGAVVVSPATAAITTPNTQAFTAVVRDLHGNVIASPPTITWASSNTAIATLSPATGSSTTATPVGGGTATITATSGGVSGAASLTVISEVAPSVTSSTPAANASNVATGSNVSVTFSEPVNLSGDWFQIACGTSGTRKPSVAGSATVTPGPGTNQYTIDPSADFSPGESCTVTVFAAQVTDQDSNDPPDNMAGDFTATFTTADNAPFVTSTTPAHQATNVAKNTNITVNFSESVAVSASSFTLACGPGGGTAQPFALTGSSPGAAFTLDPTSDLPGASTCTMTVVAAQVTDADAVDPPDNMAADFTITFQTQPNDAAPSAVNDTYGTGVGTPLTVNAPGVLGNDSFGFPAATLSSYGGGSLGGAVTDHAAGTTVTFGSGGSLTLNADGSLSFTPSAGFTGTFTFQYRLTGGTTSDATVTIAVKQAPTAVNDTYSTPQNTTLTGVNVTSNDALGVPAATVASIGAGSLGGTVTSNATPASVALAGGTLAVNADGSLSLTSPTTAGVYTFQYRLTNTEGTSDATVTITVTRPPDAKDDTFEMLKGGTLNGDLTANNGSGTDDLGVPTAAVTFFGGGSLGGTVTDHAAGTSASLAGGTLTVNANGTFSLANPTTSGVFTFSYRLTNAAGSDAATVTISVNGPPSAVDDAPAANSVPGSVLHGFINQTFTLAAPGLLANDDRGVPTGTITKFGKIQMVGSVDDNNAGTAATFLSTGSLTVNADGSVSLTPPNNFTGYVIFEYRVENSAGSDVGQATIAVGRRPAPANDTYSTSLVGNVGINTARVNGTGFSVLANDVGDQVTVQVSGPATNGNVTLNANGTFSFNPAAGFKNGNASFTYTLTNGFGTSAAATVTVPVSNTLVWFVDNTAASTGDGRLGTPFNSLTPLNGAGGSGDADGPGDNIFLYAGNTSYAGGLVMETNERLIGQGASQALAALASLSVPTDVENFPATGGTAPTLVNVAGNGVTLATGNTVRGVTLGNASGSAISGTSFGTLTVGSDVAINTTGQALSLTTGTISGSFGGTTSSGGTNNVALSGVALAGSLGTGALSGASAGALLVTNASSGALAYSGSITSSSTTGWAVRIANSGAAAACPSVTLSGAITATGLGISVVACNAGGMVFSGTKSLNTGASNGVFISGNTGTNTVDFTNGNLAITTTGSGVNAFDVTASPSLTVQGSNNTISATNGAALIVSNTTIGAAGLTFKSVSANTATNGILLNNTGASGGLTITGDGSANSGGTIQNITGAGISLTNTRNVSLTSMNIHDTQQSGINGTLVTNFSFVNGAINNSAIGASTGTASNIAFNTNPATANNIAGTFTVTGSTLTNAHYSGIDIQAGDGTITNATISSNTFTSTTSATTSVGFGINIAGVGTATTKFNLNKATISGNVITNFPTASGIQINGGNGDATGPGTTMGIPGDPNNLISITGNRVQGASSAIRMGGSAIIVAVQGANPNSRGQANISITGNGTAANPLTNIGGTVIGVGNNGYVTMTADVSNNVIVANHQPNLGGPPGIGGGDGVSGAGAAWTPSLTMKVNNNTISQTDGNGILLVNRATNGTMNLSITNNTVGAPVNAGGTARQGIRVDSGNNTAGENTNVCLKISGNTSAGSNGAAGIGVRKNGTVPTTDVFGIHGITQNPPTNADVANFINAQNPLGGNTDIISGSGYVQCATAP